MSAPGCPAPDRSDPTRDAKDQRPIARSQRTICAIRGTVRTNHCPIAPCRRRVLAGRGRMRGIPCPLREAQRLLVTSRRQQSEARRRPGAIRPPMLSLRRAHLVFTRPLGEARRARRALLRPLDALRHGMEAVRRQASTNGRRFIVSKQVQRICTEPECPLRRTRVRVARWTDRRSPPACSSFRPTIPTADLLWVPREGTARHLPRFHREQWWVWRKPPAARTSAGSARTLRVVRDLNGRRAARERAVAELRDNIEPPAAGRAVREDRARVVASCADSGSRRDA